MDLIKRSRRLLLTSFLLATTLICGSLLSPGAHAQYGPCRSDPTLILTNVGTLDLSATIYDSLSDVQKVVYVVHIPKGMSTGTLVNTTGLMGSKEVVQIYADDAANTFDTYTTVYTGQSKVSVTANSLVLSLLNVNLGSSSTSGVSGQALHIHFASLLSLL